MLNLRPLPLLAALAALLSTTSCDALWPSLCTFQPDHPGCNASIRITPDKVSLEGNTTVQFTLDDQNKFKQPEQATLTLEQDGKEYQADFSMGNQSIIHFIIKELKAKNFTEKDCNYTLSVDGTHFFGTIKITSPNSTQARHISLTEKNQKSYNAPPPSGTNSLEILGISQAPDSDMVIVTSECTSNRSSCQIYRDRYPRTPNETFNFKNGTPQTMSPNISPHFLHIPSGIIELSSNSLARWNIDKTTATPLSGPTLPATRLSFVRSSSASSDIAAMAIEENLIAMSSQRFIVDQTWLNGGTISAISIPKMSATTKDKHDIYTLSATGQQAIITKGYIGTDSTISITKEKDSTYTTLPNSLLQAPIFAVLGGNESSTMVHIIVHFPNSLISILCERPMKNCKEYPLSGLSIDGDLRAISTAKLDADDTDDIVLIWKDKFKIYHSLLVD